jgi:hypothetical protein
MKLTWSETPKHPKTRRNILGEITGLEFKPVSPFPHRHFGYQLPQQGRHLGTKLLDFTRAMLLAFVTNGELRDEAVLFGHFPRLELGEMWIVGGSGTVLH